MPIGLPERPEPEDCESLSFDAYSGMQMLSYGRKCFDVGREAGKREAAEHILSLLDKKPWNFGKDLRAYVEELK